MPASFSTAQALFTRGTTLSRMPNCPRTLCNVESRGLPSSEKDWYKVSRRKPARRATLAKPIDLTTFRSATSKSLSSPSSRTASKYAAIFLGGIELVGDIELSGRYACHLIFSLSRSLANVRARSMSVDDNK